MVWCDDCYYLSLLLLHAALAGAVLLTAVVYIVSNATSNVQLQLRNVVLVDATLLYVVGCCAGNRVLSVGGKHHFGCTADRR